MPEKTTKNMTNEPEPEPDLTAQAGDDLFKAKAPQPGTYLKAEDEHTDLDPDEVKDESDGMAGDDFLGKTNLQNRE